MLIWGRGKIHSGVLSHPAELVTQQQAVHAILVKNSPQKKSLCFLNAIKTLFGVEKQHKKPLSYGRLPQLKQTQVYSKLGNIIEIAPRKRAIENEGTLILNRILQYKNVRPLKIIMCHKKGQSRVSPMICLLSGSLEVRKPNNQSLAVLLSAAAVCEECWTIEAQQSSPCHCENERESPTTVKWPPGSLSGSPHASS